MGEDGNATHNPQRTFMIFTHLPNTTCAVLEAVDTTYGSGKIALVLINGLSSSFDVIFVDGERLLQPGTQVHLGLCADLWQHASCCVGLY